MVSWLLIRLTSSNLVVLLLPCFILSTVEVLAMMNHQLMFKSLVYSLAVECVGMGLPWWHLWRRLLLHSLSHSLLFCRCIALVLCKLGLTVLVGRFMN